MKRVAFQTIRIVVSRKKHDVPLMSLPDLKAIIKLKEMKANQYKTCDAHWLLVIVDFIDAAQDQEIPNDVLETLVSPVFEKIVIYKPQFGQIVETNRDRK